MKNKLMRMSNYMDTDATKQNSLKSYDDVAFKI